MTFFLYDCMWYIGGKGRQNVATELVLTLLLFFSLLEPFQNVNLALADPVYDIIIKWVLNNIKMIYKGLPSRINHYTFMYSS